MKLENIISKISKTKKSLKNLACAGIIGLALVGGAREAKGSLVEDYFPLNVGNSWTYVNTDDGSTKTFTIIGTEEINRNNYYKFDDYFKVYPYYGGGGGEVTEGSNVLFRHDPIADRLLMYFNGEDIIRYDFSNTKWNMVEKYIYLCRLREAGVTCSVPAGEFNNCLNFQFGSVKGGLDAYDYGEYLAPNVGNVKYVVPGGEFLSGPSEGDLVIFELQSSKIVPEPSTMFLIGAGLFGVAKLNRKKTHNYKNK